LAQAIFSFRFIVSFHFFLWLFLIFENFQRSDVCDFTYSIVQYMRTLFL